MKFFLVALTLFALMYYGTMAIATGQQSVGVKGQLKCGDAPARSVRVKLFDEDTGPDPDDELDAGYTDANGQFQLQGSTTELTTIDPVFKVYHDCNDGMTPGSRKVRFKIPSGYIFSGATPKKIFDIGVINLEIIFNEESRELIVSKKRRAAPWRDESLLEEQFLFFNHF